MLDDLSAERIPISGPSITEREIEYVTDAVKNAWYSQYKVYNERFEKAFADYLGVPFATSLPSCTSAIHLSLLALNIGKGHEVIVPDITWIASSAPISYVGATPVFADIDRKTWCISSEFEELISPRTKAVIIVDLYGNMPDVDAIRKIAYEHDIAIIEDAAEAVGTEYKGRKAGSFGDTGAFSFHGSKTLTTGEGGMLVTDDESIYKRCLISSDHGRYPDDKMFWNREIGFKYKMSCLQAALGLAQLERIDELARYKRQIFSWYESELKAVDGLMLNCEAPNAKSTYWMVTVILDKRFGIDKEKLIGLLSERNIDSRPFFYPLSSLPPYENFEQAREAQQRNKNAYSIASWGVNLPCGMNMTQEKVLYVCDVLKSILNDAVSKR
jgi:perosamine synthetase